MNGLLPVFKDVSDVEIDGHTSFDEAYDLKLAAQQKHLKEAATVASQDDRPFVKPLELHGPAHA